MPSAVKKSSTPQVKSFAPEKPLYEGCPMTLGEAVARLIALKREHNLPKKCMSDMISLIEDMIPPGKNTMLRAYYKAQTGEEEDDDVNKDEDDDESDDDDE